MKKVALITGASSGIGREIAKILIEKNYQLILSGRNQVGFDYVRQSKDVEIIIGDITSPDTRKSLLEVVKNKFGRLDLLINNAGISFIQPFEENTIPQLDEIIDINLKSPILITQGFYEMMKSQKEGTIIFINSSAGKQGYANHTLYSTTKFGLSGFAQSLRQEAKAFGIRVISIHPGGVDTGLYDRMQVKPDLSKYMNANKLAEIVTYLAETTDLSPDEITINRMSK